MCCKCFLIDEMKHTYTVTGGDCSETSEPIFNILGIFCSFLGWKERYCYSEIIMNSIASMFDEGISLRAAVGTVIPPYII
jgi:hypothetical protein